MCVLLLETYKEYKYLKFTSTTAYQQDSNTKVCGSQKSCQSHGLGM